MKDFITDHPLLVGVAFVALAVVLLVLAVRRLMFSDGGRTHRSSSTLVRSPRPADALARAGAPIDEREFSASVRRSAADRHDAPPLRPFAPDRRTDLDARVLALEEALKEGQVNTTQRFDALESRIASVESQVDPGGSESGRTGSADTIPDTLWNRDYREIGGDGVGRVRDDSVISQTIVSGSGSSIGGGWDAAAGGVGVEIRGSEVVASHSYPPEAYLTVRGGGVATVVLNPEVPHNSFALDRFALFFELGERREGMYRTEKPAEVKWDGQRGTLSTSGRAVAR